MLAAATLAHADPTPDRVFAAPTAWIAPAGAVVGTGALDLRALGGGRLESAAVVGYGLGDLAQIDIGTDADVRGCDRCDGTPRPLYLGRAAFRLGAHQDAWFRGMPALALATRVSFVDRGRFEQARVVDMTFAASRELGRHARLHAALSLIEASFRDGGETIHLPTTMRPSFGVEWTPPQYPKTSLMGDFTYVPLLTRQDDDASIGVEWVAGWGVRYQAFPWGAIDLAVRHREGEGLGDSTVFVRVHGARR